MTRRSRQASSRRVAFEGQLSVLRLDSRYRRNRPILGSRKRYRGERGERGNNLDGSPITPVSWPSASSSGGPPKIHPSPPLLSLLLSRRGRLFQGHGHREKETRYLDNFKNNLNFGFEGYAFLLLKEIPDIISENERRRMKGIGRVNRIVPITRALCLFFFSLGGGGGRADLRGYCDRGRAQATTDEYIL